ncbi:hypothetical protein HK100_004388 [Physocladia obscura]|uniref:Aminoglycoside phosphotransferase domain-containing protein n=1 Tax=Physocladia obscura TaxID=109957 RepID=A0AAD5SUH3_9FUNG|nr:hypothetical protein HK100_004388 [Physocladia obscura]
MEEERLLESANISSPLLRDTLSKFNLGFQKRLSVSVNKTGFNSTVFIVSEANANRKPNTTTDHILVMKHAANQYSRQAVAREQQKLQLLETQSNMIPRSFGYLVDEAVTPYHYVLSFLLNINGADGMTQCRSHGDSTRDWATSVFTDFYTPKITSRALNMVTGSKQSLPNEIEEESKARENKYNKGETALKQMEHLKAAINLPPDHEFWGGEFRDLVFLHGDCMLPNFLFARQQTFNNQFDWNVTGIVDLADSGYGDKRFDLRAALWSVRYNCELMMRNNTGITGIDWSETMKNVNLADMLADLGIPYTSKNISSNKSQREISETWTVFSDIYDLFNFYVYDEKEE